MDDDEEDSSSIACLLFLGDNGLLLGAIPMVVVVFLNRDGIAVLLVVIYTFVLVLTGFAFPWGSRGSPFEMIQPH